MEALSQQWARYWPDADITALVSDVRDRAQAAVAAWGLRRVRPLNGGNVALVLAADDVVLKVHPRGHADDAQLAAEGEALAAWASTDAAVELHDRRDDGFTLLLERLVPGTTLDWADVSWDERLDVLGTLVRRLHSTRSPVPDSVPHIGDDYSRDWRRALGDSPLLDPSAEDVLLHADLHGANALRHGADWRAIDPHAVRGDRHADVWALIDPLAPVAPDTRTAWSWVERYAAAANLDPVRAAEWIRLRARAEALNGAEGDAAWAARLTRTAELLRV
ncbi:aminoglycoside phosphotransferase family protein [Gordonia sp. CPCC 206044]|uniref:aminoglycoside phosphotransferase family protein n=1 Tax=Gordonia sp. CPCC 206044 TaxID=3140793 RepID=UPI003AF3971D